MSDPTECPKCECNDIRVAGSVERFGRKYRVWLCADCGKRWNNAPNVPPRDSVTVDYVATKCPHCKSKKTKVTSTLGPRRYHQCKDCLSNFQSQESPLERSI